MHHETARLEVKVIILNWTIYVRPHNLKFAHAWTVDTQPFSVQTGGAKGKPIQHGFYKVASSSLCVKCPFKSTCHYLVNSSVFWTPTVSESRRCAWGARARRSAARASKWGTALGCGRRCWAVTLRWPDDCGGWFCCCSDVSASYNEADNMGIKAGLKARAPVLQARALHRVNTRLTTRREGCGDQDALSELHTHPATAADFLRRAAR